MNDVAPWTKQTDNHTILNITVTHHNFYSGHFVDSIEIDVDGTIQSIIMKETSPVYQSIGSTWIFQYDLGVVSGRPLVRVGAYCNIPGGGWSTTVQVPEFSLIQITLVMAVLLVSVMFLRYKRLYIC